MRVSNSATSETWSSKLSAEEEAKLRVMVTPFLIEGRLYIEITSESTQITSSHWFFQHSKYLIKIVYTLLEVSAF